MKYLATQFSYYFADNTFRQNLRALMRFIGLLVVVITVFAILFHFIMLYEDRRHSWITGFYWTLTVMSTLGFGDITFTSDLGRFFSIVVLLTGIVMLLIVLPFAFIRYFYGPWLEAQIHMRAPRAVPPDTRGHVLLCAFETISAHLAGRLATEGIPYFIIEPDPNRAATLYNQGFSVVAGDVDSTETYRRLRVEHARMVVANDRDTVNTNIALTVREVAPEVPLVSVASAEASIDVLELSGATHVLPLKRRLGEHLANRVSAAHARSQIIGRYRDLLIAELPVRHTPLSGKTIRATRLRESTGLNILAVWQRGRLHPATPDLPLTDASVPVLSGTPEQFDILDDLLVIYDHNPNPVLVIGGGRVGRSTARALRAREVPVHLVERDPRQGRRAARVADRVFEGNAAEFSVLVGAGLREAPSVVLTTHDDAMNIYLASYCRRLNPDVRIVSRVTHERNIESIHRAGADFVLSYATLGVTSLLSLLHGNELVLLGEGLDLFSYPVPRALRGRTLADSGIGAETGLIVIGIEAAGAFHGNPPASTVLPAGGALVLLGGPEQRRQFAGRYV